MTQKTIASFPTHAVAGALTGYVLVDRGFSEISAVFEHFFPGIFTLGIAAMADHAKAEIKRQHPELAAFCEKRSESDFQQPAALASDLVRAFGETLTVEGPLEVSQEEIKAAFARLP